MILRRARLVGLAAVAAGAAALLLPASASAHGIVGRTDLPIPRWLFAWAAAIVLVISFVALAALWPRPRLEQVREREIARYPRFLEPLAGLIGVALYVVVIYAGIAGTQLPTANLDPTFIYVVFWVGLAIASLLFGDVFRPFNPWRAVARAFVFVWRRVRGDRAGVSPVADYPAWLGRWPAALGLLGFAWLELVYVNKDHPDILAGLALAYGAVQLVGMGLYGIETWTERADAFSVYFGLFARLSPLRWEGGRIYLRPPFVGAIDLEMMPGTVALLAVMIGSTSFDGFSVGSAWATLEPHVQKFFSDLGASTTPAIELAFSTGLVGLIVIIGAFYRLGVLGMRSLGHYSATELSRRFVHTLLPISLAYVIAHYFSLLAYQGQAIAYLASDPLGNGSNLFGTASDQINYGAVTANAIWYVQVAALLVGHAAALALAHDRALVLYRRTQEAVRSQYWMLTVMVGFTSLGLWILSSTH